jgi:hypothetical protein
MLRWPTPKQLELFRPGVASRQALDAFTQRYMRPLLLERLGQLSSLNLASRYAQLVSAESTVARLGEQIAELDRLPLSAWQPVLDDVAVELHEASNRLASSLTQSPEEDPPHPLDALTAPTLSEAGPAHGSSLVQSYASRLCSDALRTAALVTQRRHTLAAVTAAEGAASPERGSAADNSASAVQRAVPVRPLIESAIADAASAVEQATGLLPTARFLPGATPHATVLRGSLPFAAGEVLFAALHASAALAVERSQPAQTVEVEIGFSRGSLALRVSDAAGGIAPPDAQGIMRFGHPAGKPTAGHGRDELGASAGVWASQGGGELSRLESGQFGGSECELGAYRGRVGEDVSTRLARVLSPPMRSGLALARLHARYHGGGIAVCSHYGGGTHTYLTLDASGATGG